MKKAIIPILTTILFIGCGSNHDHSTRESATDVVSDYTKLTPSASLKASLEDVLEAYFELKDQLVATSAETAAPKAETLGKRVNALIAAETSFARDNEALNEKLSLAFQNVAGKAETIHRISDVEEQREQFESLSESLILIAKTYGPFTNPIYVQTCPMVRDGSADWLSLEQNVMNPYHGSRMLRCGSMVEVI